MRISYVGIVLVAVSIVLFLIIENAQHELKEKIGRDLQTLAEMEVEGITQHIGENIRRMKSLSRKYVFKSGDTAAMNEYLQAMGEGFSMVSVVDLDGVIKASSERGIIGHDLNTILPGTGAFVEDAKKTNTGKVLYRCMYGDSDKKHLMAFLLFPVATDTGNRIAVFLAGVVDLDVFLEAESSGRRHIVSGEKAHAIKDPPTMIITQDGVAQVFAPLVYLQENSPVRELVKEDKRSGYTVYKDYSGDDVLAGYADVGGYESEGADRWSIISMAPKREVFYPAIRLRNKVIVLGGIAVAVAWVLAFFVARGITRPIRELVTVTDRIAEGDLSQRADIKLNDEVGDLARSFNTMTDKLGAAIVHRDQEIIERKNAEEKLREEVESTAKFVSMIAKEFKTPLISIREGMRIVLEDMGSNLNDDQKALLDLARKSGDNLNKLINDIVHFHKLETDKIEFHMEENDINEVIADVRRTMLPLLSEKKDVELVVNVDETLPKARFDLDKITLVLTNVLNMAINFTEKGSITVTAGKEGDKGIRVSVQDSGIAIADDDLEKLFHRFEPIGKSRDKMSGGTGLGLAISREIMNGHKGRIWAESRKGKGTAFIFVLSI